MQQLLPWQGATGSASASYEPSSIRIRKTKFKAACAPVPQQTFERSAQGYYVAGDTFRVFLPRRSANAIWPKELSLSAIVRWPQFSRIGGSVTTTTPLGQQMANEFDEKIAAVNKDIAQHDEVKAQGREEFLQAAALWLKDWYWEKAEKAVLEQSRVTESHGDNIADLKASIRKLQEKSREYINKHVGTNEIWEKWQSQKGSYRHYELKDDIETALRRAFGELGRLLLQFGYDKSSSGHGHVWEVVPGGVKYNTGFKLSEALGNKVEECSSQIQKACDLRGSLDSLQTQKSQSRAKRLWDDAE